LDKQQRTKSECKRNSRRKAESDDSAKERSRYEETRSHEHHIRTGLRQQTAKSAKGVGDVLGRGNHRFLAVDVTTRYLGELAIHTVQRKSFDLRDRPATVAIYIVS
jgi:hypothetical protein